MMDNELYEGWFGIPFSVIEQEQINKLREDLIVNDYSTDNSSNNYLSKKRTHKIFIYGTNSSIESEEKSKVNSELEESLINIDNIIIPEKIIEKNKGLITYNGFNDESYNNNKLNMRYIYLNEGKKIELNKEKVEYKWKIKFIKFSKNKNYIGVGLADKDIVIKNKNIFKKSNDNYSNGVFCLLCKYLEDRESNLIFAKLPTKNILDDYIVNFPPFKQGQEITMIYNVSNKKLIFISKKNKMYKMEEVKTMEDNGNFVPCVVFGNPGDVVQISDVEENNEDEKLNWG